MKKLALFIAITLIYATSAFEQTGNVVYAMTTLICIAFAIPIAAIILLRFMATQNPTNFSTWSPPKQLQGLTTLSQSDEMIHWGVTLVNIRYMTGNSEPVLVPYISDNMTYESQLYLNWLQEKGQDVGVFTKPVSVTDFQNWVETGILND